MICRIYWIFFFIAISVCSGKANTLNLEELLGEYYKAQGGLNALFQIKSLRASGTIHINGDDYRLTLIKKAPNKVRKLLQKDDRVYIEAYNGEVAWKKAPNEAAERLSDKASRALIASAPILNYLIRSKKEDIKVTLVDTTSFVNNTPCYHLRLVLPSNNAVEYFIDKCTFLEKRIVYENTSDGKRQISSSELSNYKPVKDFKQPFLIKSTTEGQAKSSFAIESIDINVGVSSQYFEFPEES